MLITKTPVDNLSIQQTGAIPPQLISLTTYASGIVRNFPRIAIPQMAEGRRRRLSSEAVFVFRVGFSTISRPSGVNRCAKPHPECLLLGSVSKCVLAGCRRCLGKHDGAQRSVRNDCLMRRGCQQTRTTLSHLKMSAADMFAPYCVSSSGLQFRQYHLTTRTCLLQNGEGNETCSG